MSERVLVGRLVAGKVLGSSIYGRFLCVCVRVVADIEKEVFAKNVFSSLSLSFFILPVFRIVFQVSLVNQSLSFV